MYGSRRFMPSIESVIVVAPKVVAPPLYPIEIKPPRDRVKQMENAGHQAAYSALWSGPAFTIMHIVAAGYNLTFSKLRGANRFKSVARPRQIAMYLVRELTGMSLPQIGRLMGNRDHSTIIYGVKCVENLIKNDPNLAKDVDAMRNVFNGIEKFRAPGNTTKEISDVKTAE